MSENMLSNRLGDPQLTEEQQRTLKRFDMERVASGKGKSLSNRLNYAKVLGDLGKACPKPYEEMAKKDLVEFLASKDMAESTRQLHAIVLKRFFRWLYGLPKGQYPEQVSWMEVGSSRSKVTKSDLVTGDELKRMIAMSPNSRDRAVVAVLWESAFRLGEFLGLNVGDVEEKPYGFALTVRISKTETRTVPIVQTAIYLAQWLNSHPSRDDPRAPLWMSFATNTFGQRIKGGAALNGILKRAAKLAGVEKRVHAHLLRHSRLTNLVKLDMRESALRGYAGWTPGSKMPGVYVHLSGVDIEKAALRTSGVEVEPERPALESRECPRCKTVNDPHIVYCVKCGLNLDNPTFIEDRMRELERQREEDRKMTQELKNLIQERLPQA